MDDATTYDLVVVGCGAAGLSAAHTYAQDAAERGERVRIAVLERATREDRGGATRWTGATFRVDAEGRLDPGFSALMADVSEGKADAESCRVLEAEAPTTVALLRDVGVELVELPLEVAATAPGYLVPIGGGEAIVNALAAHVDAADGTEIIYGTEATELIVDGEGRVCGVRVRDASGSSRELRAGAVVLACGGFEGNPELLREHVDERADRLGLIAPGIANNRGDGLRMATAIGADTAGDFGGIHSELIDTRTTTADAVIMGTALGIVVNQDGDRFYDEGKAPIDATFEMIALDVWRDQDQRAYFISDEAVFGRLQFPQFAYLTDQPPITADTIEDLAEALGLDPAVLRAKVDAFNAACDPDTPFDPSRPDGKATRSIDPPKSNWASPIAHPPYRGYPVTTAITFTYGGLRADTNGRVLTAAGEPIEGLYAAGELVGLYWHEYPAGTQVLRALTWGRLAARHAAATVGAGTVRS